MEFLLNYREVRSNRLTQVHICNVDNESKAVVLASNSILSNSDDDIYELDSVTQTDTNPIYCPF